MTGVNDRDHEKRRNINDGERPWIAYVGPFEFPWGRAASRRVYFIAKAVASLGPDVRILAASAPRSEFCEYEQVSDAGSIGWIDLDEFPTSSGLRRIADWSWRMGVNSVRWLDEQRQLPTHVIIYGGSLSYTRQILNWANQRNVAVLLDLVEWYDKSAFRGRRANPQYWAEAWSRRFLHRKAAGVIAISTLLARRYDRLGMPVVVVPPGAESREPTKIARTRIRRDFIYAGIPGTKDDIVTMVDALEECEGAGIAVGLTVCGPTAEELKALIGEIPSFIDAVGPIPQEKVGDLVGNADFSILIRPDTRSSHAGFPTKFVESLSVGTPVVANLTSDIGTYLRSGYNGVVAHSTCHESVAAAIRTAATTTDMELDTLRRNAHATSSRFHWRNSTGAIESLLRRTQGGQA